MLIYVGLVACGCLRRRRRISERCVGGSCAPLFDGDLRLLQAVEYFLVETLVTKLLRYPGFSARHRRRLALRHQHFNLTKQHNNLLRAKPLPGISKLLCQPILSRGLVQNSQSGQAALDYSGFVSVSRLILATRVDCVAIVVLHR